MIAKIREKAQGAINQTYKVLVKRIDKFGVAQPNINLDKDKGVISVELAGVNDPESVRKFLQSSANLQFWEVYTLGEPGLGERITAADKALQNYLNGVSTTDSTSLNDSTKAAMNEQPLIRVVRFNGGQKAKDGREYYPAAIASVDLKDTGRVNEYLDLEVVKNNFPGDLKFMYGIEEKDDKGKKYLPAICSTYCSRKR